VLTFAAAWHYPAMGWELVLKPAQVLTYSKKTFKGFSLMLVQLSKTAFESI
jgi:hypothetical protein